MLSHDNVTWTSRIGAEQYSWDQERILSYLPLSHIAGIMEDIFITIYAANEIHFADKEVLKSTLVENLVKQKRGRSVIGIGIIGSIYAIFGGLKAVAISDTINGYGLLIGGLAIPLIALVSIGDGNPMTGLLKVFENSPEKFNVIGAKDSVMPFEVLFTGLIINQIYFWSMNQTIIQRALGAKNLVEAQKDTFISQH